MWEDSLITLRHSENLLKGEGLTYNPGTRVHGFTSPINVLLLTVCRWASGQSSYLTTFWLYRIFTIPAFAAGGLLLLNLVTLGRIGIEIAYAYYEVERGPGQAAQGVAHFLLRVGSESLTASIPSAAAVLLIWVLVATPRRALDATSVRWLFGLGAPAAAPPREAAERQPAGEGESEGGPS